MPRTSEISDVQEDVQIVNEIVYNLIYFNNKQLNLQRKSNNILNKYR